MPIFGVLVTASIYQSIQWLRYRLAVPVNVALLSEGTREFFLLQSVQTESEAPSNLFSTVTGSCFPGGRATSKYDLRLTPPTTEISGALPPITHGISGVQMDGFTYFSYTWYCSQLFTWFRQTNVSSVCSNDNDLRKRPVRRTACWRHVFWEAKCHPLFIKKFSAFTIYSWIFHVPVCYSKTRRVIYTET